MPFGARRFIFTRMSDVVCMGEVMLRLSTPLHTRLPDAPFLDLCFGGAEANVAVQLANLGSSAAFASRLPENELGDRCVEALRGRGVNVASILRGGSRMGVYFVSPGYGLRATSVLYERAGSSMAEATPGMFAWDSVFAGAKWFHWSGITPALSPHSAALCREALVAAKRAGLTVSFDLNYRSKLWTTSEAAEALQPLMEFVDVCVCGADEATSILGAPSAAGSDLERMESSARWLAKYYSFSRVAMTRRSGENAHETGWQAMLLSASDLVISREYALAIVDRIGTGDSFTGGLIFSLLRGDSAQAAIDFAAAAGAWKHTIPGDWNRATVAEIEALAAGRAGAAVRR